MHLALKQTTAKHTTREQMTEKIKQQVHLNAVRNYQAPSVDVKTIMELESRPLKSILKKGQSTSNGVVRKGRVNYAFDDQDETKTEESSGNEHKVKVEIHKY